MQTCLHNSVWGLVHSSRVLGLMCPPALIGGIKCHGRVLFRCCTVLALSSLYHKSLDNIIKCCYGLHLCLYSTHRIVVVVVLISLPVALFSFFHCVLILSCSSALGAATSGHHQRRLIRRLWALCQWRAPVAQCLRMHHQSSAASGGAWNISR